MRTIPKQMWHFFYMNYIYYKMSSQTGSEIQTNFPLFLFLSTIYYFFVSTHWFLGFTNVECCSYFCSSLRWKKILQAVESTFTKIRKNISFSQSTKLCLAQGNISFKLEEHKKMHEYHIIKFRLCFRVIIIIGLLNLWAKKYYWSIDLN